MLTQSEASAIEAFVFGATVPLLCEREDGPILIGTGTFFEIRERSFVITAAHVIDAVEDFDRFGCPEKPTGGAVISFGCLNIFRADVHEIDVAILELKDTEFVSAVKESWSFMRLINITLPTQVGTFFLSGYPSSRTKLSGEKISGNIITAYTRRLRDTPIEAKNVNQDIDLFFEYGYQAQEVSGRTIATPKLQGTSGASIWQIVKPEGTLWVPQQVTKIVAVQSAYVHRKYLRAISWALIAQIFVKIDKKLEEEIFGAINKRV